MHRTEAPKFLPMPPRLVSAENSREVSPVPQKDSSLRTKLHASRWELGSLVAGFAGRALATRLGLPPEIIADTLKAASVTSMMTLPLLEVVQYTALRKSASGSSTEHQTRISEVLQKTSRVVTLAAIAANVEGGLHPHLQSTFSELTDLSLYASHLPDTTIPMVGTVQFHETPHVSAIISESNPILVAEEIPTIQGPDSIPAHAYEPVLPPDEQPGIVDQTLTDLSAHQEYTGTATLPFPEATTTIEGIISGLPEEVIPVTATEPTTLPPQSVSAPSLPSEAYDVKPPIVATMPAVPANPQTQVFYYFDDTTPSGQHIEGTIENLKINDLDWILLDNGELQISQLISDLGLDIDQAQFKSELQLAVTEYKNGTLDDNSPRGRLFHLCNGTESMDTITHSPQMIEDLKALGIVS